MGPGLDFGYATDNGICVIEKVLKITAVTNEVDHLLSNDNILSGS